MATKNVVEQVARPLCSNLSAWSRKAYITFVGSFFLMCMVFSTAAFAVTYYVATNGSDSSNGSTGAPFRTIQKAANVVNPGDTVIVRDGVYKGGSYSVVNVMNKSGNASAWITFKSENKWGAVIDGERQNDSDVSNNTGIGWQFYNASYIRVEGFELRYTSGTAFGAYSNANHIYLYRNKFHDIGRRQVACDDPGVLYGITGVYTDPTVTDLTVDSNIVYNIGRLPGGCSSYDYNHDHGLYLKGSYTTIINNTFYDNKAGWSVLFDASAHHDAVNNTFYGANPGRDGQIILSGSCSDVLIENNISYSPTTYFIQAANSGDSNVVIKNNLVYGAALPDAACSYAACSGNIIGKDPKFADLTKHDFHLQAGSPAIDKGIAYPGLSSDADGNAITGSADIGAYEYTAATAVTIQPEATPTGDTTPPLTPSGLAAVAASSTQINLSWAASTDNVGVTGYKVYRNGTQVATTATTTYADAGLLASTSYTYGVAAYDAAGNCSIQSGSVSGVTKAVSTASICTTTLSAALSINGVLSIPDIDVGGTYLWSSAACHIAMDGAVMCKVTGYGETTPNNLSDCGIASITPGPAIHVPDLLFQGRHYWVDLQYVPTSDGFLWLKMAGAGAI